MTIQEKINEFLAGTPHAVVGASTDRAKYGNKVLRAYLQNGREVFPVNPNSEEVEGLASFPDLASLPRPVHGISLITRPEVTERIVQEAAGLGIRNIWMQPGAESEKAVERATIVLKENGFGVLTEIDIKEKLKEKLDVDFKRYIILGACNPPLAHRALQAEPEIGLLLPCNVIVYEIDDEQSVVSAIDPAMMVQVVPDNKAVQEVAVDAKIRLTKAINEL